MLRTLITDGAEFLQALGAERSGAPAARTRFSGLAADSLFQTFDRRAPKIVQAENRSL
jgi:hypothetical protein